MGGDGVHVGVHEVPWYRRGSIEASSVRKALYSNAAKIKRSQSEAYTFSGAGNMEASLGSLCREVDGGADEIFKLGAGMVAVRFRDHWG